MIQRQRMFGYTDEDLRLLLTPMAVNGEEPIGSMGTDSAMAVLSDRPHLLYDYFQQTFAQVTNPPLDAIREQLVTTMSSTVGPEGNLLDPQPESCRQINIEYPVIDNIQLARLRHVYLPAFRSTTIPTLFDPARGGAALERAVEELKQRASDAVDAGYTIVILSDRGADRDRAPIPSLLATAAVHHHLVRQGTRTRCGLVVESGDAREVHHCALLLGYGAGVVNPYLAFETIAELVRDGHLPGVTFDAAVEHYIKALNKGILKVMSKMGISTLQSYCGAQIFEAIGLDGRFVAKHFTGTSSRIGGIGLPEIARETLERHRRAYAPGARDSAGLTVGGEYQWRRGAETHLFTPETVFKLQHATRTGQYAIFKEYTQAGRRSDAAVRDAPRPARPAPGDHAGSDRRGGAGRADRQALRHRRDVVRLDQRGGAHDAGHRDEPPRRQVEHRRRRRGSGALPPRGQRRLEAQRRSSRSRRPASA